MDDAEQALRQQERQTLFKEYCSKRQAVLQVRNADREKRNDMKTQQLELVEQWQVRTGQSSIATKPWISYHKIIMSERLGICVRI